MVHPDKITSELIEAYERPFRGVEGRRAYLRVARGLRTEDLSSRMDAVERLEAPTLVIWGENDVFQQKALGERLARTMANRSEEHTYELQSIMRTSYADLCLKQN